MSKILIVLLLATGLSACVGKVKKELNCAEENWVTVGYNTAKAGKSIRSFDAYNEVCGTNLPAGAKEAYIDGYTKGIIEFCTYENGYFYGENNMEDPKICPYEVRRIFTKGYSQGQIVLKDKIRQMKNHTSDKQDRIQNERPAPVDQDSQR